MHTKYLVECVMLRSGGRVGDEDDDDDRTTAAAAAKNQGQDQASKGCFQLPTGHVPGSLKGIPEDTAEGRGQVRRGVSTVALTGGPGYRRKTRKAGGQGSSS